MKKCGNDYISKDWNISIVVYTGVSEIIGDSDSKPKSSKASGVVLL